MSLDAEGQRLFDAINAAVTGKVEEYPRPGPVNSSMYSLAVAEPYDRINQLLRKVAAATIDAIRYNRSTAGLPEKDRVLIEFGRQLLRQHRLDTPTYNKMVELFGKQGMIEMTMTLGDYVMTAILLNAVNQQVPADQQPVNLPINRK